MLSCLELTPTLRTLANARPQPAIRWQSCGVEVEPILRARVSVPGCKRCCTGRWPATLSAHASTLFVAQKASCIAVRRRRVSLLHCCSASTGTQRVAPKASAWKLERRMAIVGYPAARMKQSSLSLAPMESRRGDRQSLLAMPLCTQRRAGHNAGRHGRQRAQQLCDSERSAPMMQV